MKPLWCRGLAALALLGLLAGCRSGGHVAATPVPPVAFAPPSVDTVKLTNDSGDENGLFVFGRWEPNNRTEQRIFAKPGSVIPVGDVQQLGSPPEVTNLVAAFTRDRPMALRLGGAWGPQGVEVPLAYAAEPVTIPLHLWVVWSPSTPEETESLLRAGIWSLLTTQMTWHRERMGTRLLWEEITTTHVSNRAGAAALVDFDSGAYANNNERLAALHALGHDPGAVNVYFVRSVNGLVTLGLTLPIGGDTIVMPSRPHPTLLVHELGHAFALGEADTRFDVRNVMRADSVCRRYLAEGQIFQAYTKPASAVFDVADTPHNAIAAGFGTWPKRMIPHLDMRIWEDGPGHPPGLGSAAP